jgi:hypothetical protein
MASRIHDFVIESVLIDIRANCYSMYNIAKRNGVGTSVVQRLFATHMYEIRHRDSGVMGMGKTEPYQTEEQALGGLPTYTASNHEKIKPIREDWKLITYEGTIKTLYK